MVLEDCENGIPNTPLVSTKKLRQKTASGHLQAIHKGLSGCYERQRAESVLDKVTVELHLQQLPADVQYPHDVLDHAGVRKAPEVLP